MRNFAAAIFLLLSLTSYSQPDRAWVKIETDYGMGARIDTVTFVISDGYTPQTVYSAPDENGVFLAGFDISNSTDILWSFRDGKSLPLIISPNDTLHITILSETDGVLFGKRARTCANLMEMHDAPNRPRVQAFESEFKKEPDAFVDLMNRRLNDHLRFANKFCSSTKCTKTFVTWYLKSAYVSYYRNLADYCHSFQKGSYADAAEMNVFLRARDVIVKAIDLTDPTLEMSSGYYDLLKSIFSLYVMPNELRSLYYTKASMILLEKSGINERDKRSLQRVQSGGVAESDIGTLARLSQKYKREINAAVWSSIDPSVQQKLGEIKDQEIRKVIFAYYKGIRNWI